MAANDIAIRIVPGSMAPRFDEAYVGLDCEEAVITERGTVAGLPIVDLRMRDADGKPFVLMLTGRILLGLASTIRGINERNHGRGEP